MNEENQKYYKMLIARSRKVYKVSFTFSVSTVIAITLKNIVGLMSGQKDFPYKVE
jgi:hypothetical protein